MQNELIALRGKGGSGKTTSIGLLHGLLLAQTGSRLLETTFTIAAANKDFISIFEINGILVGVTSKGDTYDHVKGDLDQLIGKKCTILICACRTTDRTNKKGIKRGSNLAIDQYTAYRSHRINKSVSGMASTQAANNQKDAERLLKKCIEFV